MSRLSIFNMAIGFLLLFFSACAGAFVSFDMTNAFLRDPTLLDSWQLTLLKSSHGHTNLFGMIHVLFGLTLPYSRLPESVKKYQTLGLCAGSFAMGPLMMIKAYSGPQDSFDPLGLLIGVCLSAALLVLGTHASALFYRFVKRY